MGIDSRIPLMGSQFNPMKVLAQTQQIQAQDQQNKLADLKLKQYEQSVENQNQLRGLLPEIAQGNNAAFQQGLSIDPQMAMQVRAAWQKMDDAQKARAADIVTKGSALLGDFMKVPEAQRAQYWPRVAQGLMGIGITDTPQQYDPQWVQGQLAEAGTLGAVMQEAMPTYGNPQQAMGENGQPVFIQTSKRGDVRELPGYRPMPKKGIKVTNADGSTVEIGGSGNQDLSSSTVNNLQGKKFDAVNSLSRLNEIEKSFDPGYMEFTTRWGHIWSSLKEKAGQKLSKGEATELRDFSKFRVSAVGNVNQTIKEMTGAAMAESEAKRLRGQIPDPGTGLFDGDSPTEFQAKLDTVVRDTKRAIIRYHYALSNNIDPLATGIELSDVDQLLERRGREVEAAIRQANPDMADLDVQAEVFKQVSQEFGL